jgi:hypothetical protein
MLGFHCNDSLLPAFFRFFSTTLLSIIFCCLFVEDSATCDLSFYFDIVSGVTDLSSCLLVAATDGQEVAVASRRNRSKKKKNEAAFFLLPFEKKIEATATVNRRRVPKQNDESTPAPWTGRPR